MPDLRFAIGAVIAVALLSVTAFGFGAAMHIARQAKVSPLEASRMLAYSPAEARGREPDAFARLPVGGGLRQTANEVQVAAETAAVSAAAETPAAAGMSPAEAAPPPEGDPDTVDERAVVDPPLPLLPDVAVEAPPAPDSLPPAQATELPAETERPEPAPIAQAEAAEAPAAEPAPAIATAAAPAAAIETTPTPAEAAPANDIAAAHPPEPEPVAGLPPPPDAAPPSEVDTVGSLPPPRDVDAPQPVTAKKVAPKAKAKKRKTAPKTAAVAKAQPKVATKAKPRIVRPAAGNLPTASTGYVVTNDGMWAGGLQAAPAGRVRGAARPQSIWPGD